MLHTDDMSEILEADSDVSSMISGYSGNRLRIPRRKETTSDLQNSQKRRNSVQTKPCLPVDLSNFSLDQWATLRQPVAEPDLVHFFRFQYRDDYSRIRFSQLLKVNRFASLMSELLPSEKVIE